MKNTTHADLKPSLIDLEADNNATGGKQDISSVQPERLSERDNIYCVYWIGTLEHNNFFQQGYIGITKNLKNRIYSHFKNKRKTILTNVFKKYKKSDLIIKILHSNLTLEESLKLENFYRPSLNIGWNLQIGGNIGVESEWYNIPENKEKHSRNTSIKTKEGIKLKDSKEARSNRAKKSWENGYYKIYI